jgi:hypothetical protein
VLTTGTIFVLRNATTSIDVVAFRKTKIVPVVSTRAQLRHDLAS